MKPTINTHSSYNSRSLSKLQPQEYPAKPHILIVEDNVINQKIETLFLKDMGYENIDIAANGTDALHLIYNNVYSLILTDIGLPDINGIQIAKKIRNNSANRSVPIIAITAFDHDLIKNKCYEAGINHLLEKPINMNNFKNTVGYYLNKYNIM